MSRHNGEEKLLVLEKLHLLTMGAESAVTTGRFHCLESGNQMRSHCKHRWFPRYYSTYLQSLLVLMLSIYCCSNAKTSQRYYVKEWTDGLDRVEKGLGPVSVAASSNSSICLFVSCFVFVFRNGLFLWNSSDAYACISRHTILQQGVSISQGLLAWRIFEVEWTYCGSSWRIFVKMERWHTQTHTHTCTQTKKVMPIE